jgi:hypothetical protein
MSWLPGNENMPRIFLKLPVTGNEEVLKDCGGKRGRIDRQHPVTI